MAKPKEKNHVECLANAGPFKNSGVLHIWCDDPGSVLAEVARLEGISSVMLFANDKMIHAITDPRYDAEELAQEVRDLLAADVPEVFRE